MVFNSLHFALFFPVVVIIFFLTPLRARQLVLLCASYYFYLAWQPAYVFLLIMSTISTWLGALAMDRFPCRRRGILIVTIAANLGMLGFFKYGAFLAHNVNAAAALLLGHRPFPDFTILLPIGISFYTFQSLGYLIDVSRGAVRAERHLLPYALFVSFFPQLVAGPIERARDLLPQFSVHRPFRYESAVRGLRLIAWGLFKKIVIADRLAVLVTWVYGSPDKYQGIPLILATVCFGFQIYCDFSGYSDIAIGCARMLGFSLSTNFRAPYHARSIREFWRRWHITLISWLRDYLYLPLGGNRTSRSRHLRNIMIVCLCSGLWHGAQWTFILWGALHGIYLSAEVLTARARERLSTRLAKLPASIGPALETTGTFALVSFAWILFRATSVRDAGYIMTHLGAGIRQTVQALLRCDWHSAYTLVTGAGLGLPLPELVCAFFFVIVLVAVERTQRMVSITNLFERQPLLLRWLLYYVMGAVLVCFGKFGQQEFIYFQF